MRVEVLQDLARVQALQPAWDRLWSADATADVFATCDWFLNWWDHFGQGDQKDPIVTHDGADIVAAPGRGLQLHVCTVRDESDELIAVLPLVSVFGLFKGVPARILSTPVNGHAPRSGLLARRYGPDVAACLCEALVSHGAWDVMLLEGLPSNCGRVRELISQLHARGFVPAEQTTWLQCYLRFQGNWQEFLASKRRHFRKRYEWAERDLAKLGELRVERFNGAEAATHGMALFLAIDRASWKAREGETIDSIAALERYYRGVCERLGTRSLAEIWVLLIGRKAAAAYICLYDGRSRYTLKTSFSETFGSSHHSPSKVLLGCIIRNSWGAGGEGIDFVGKMPFVERWANEGRRYEQAVFYRSRVWALRVLGRDKLRQIFRKAKTAAKHIRSSVSGEARARDA